MTDQKTTRKDLFTRIIAAMSEDAEVVAMCEKYIEQLSKPRVVKVKPEQEAFRADVLDLLKTFEDGATNKEMCAKYAEEHGETVSAQKMAAALRWLVQNGDAETMETAKSDPKRYIVLPDDGDVEFDSEPDPSIDWF